MLRLSLHGTLRPEKYPELNAIRAAEALAGCKEPTRRPPS
jgi:hypothetical protein